MNRSAGRPGSGTTTPVAVSSSGGVLFLTVGATTLHVDRATAYEVVNALTEALILPAEENAADPVASLCEDDTMPLPLHGEDLPPGDAN